MSVVRPFRALRPIPEAAKTVAAVPYDVVTTAEARDLAAGNPLSFLHVSRAEIDLDPEVDAYDDLVYRRSAENLETLRINAPLVVEEAVSLYVYRLEDGEHQQTGLAGCFSLDEYDRGLIKRHERTRPDKEDDRTRHMLALGAQTGIVFLTYRVSAAVDALMVQACQSDPLFDIAAPDGVGHTVWRVDGATQRALVEAFAQLPCLYIADGHHRIASAARAREELATTTADPEAEACFFLGVAFPDRETQILPYNRTVANLAGLTPSGFIDAVQAKFPVHADAASTPPKGQVAMYLDGRWYVADLSGSDVSAQRSAAARLDVAVLQDQILSPILQVVDVRTDPRITFVGGARGTKTLEALVDSGSAAVAFSLAAVTSDELLAISDAGEIMPPKSTWFEPKLRDGLLLHLL